MLLTDNKEFMVITQIHKTLSSVELSGCSILFLSQNILQKYNVGFLPWSRNGFLIFSFFSLISSIPSSSYFLCFIINFSVYSFQVLLPLALAISTVVQMSYLQLFGWGRQSNKKNSAMAIFIFLGDRIFSRLFPVISKSGDKTQSRNKPKMSNFLKGNICDNWGQQKQPYPTVMGWIVSPSKSCVEILTPSTSECDCA